MADIVITTDFSQVNQLNDTLKSTGNLFTRVVDSLMREETRAKRVTKALAKTTEDNLALVERAEAIVAEKVQVAAQKREKARQREADRAEKEAKRIAAAAEKAAKAEAKLAQEVASNQAKAAQQSTAGLNQRLGVTGSSAMNSGAGFGALEQQVERLRLKYDQVYASSQLYEKSLKELNQAEMLGVLSVKQHEAALESLNAEYQAFQSGVAQAGNRFAQHVNQTSDGMNKFGVAAQQTGYQVSDFIVQVQSGTNPLVAFSQQATQLAGLLYLLPPSMQAATVGFAGFSISMATATAGLTILIPLLAMIAMNFIGSGKESDEASKKIDKQAQAYENLKAKVEELRLARQMEASGAQSQDEQINLNEINALIRERNALQNQTLLLTSQEMIVASGGRSQLAADYSEDQANARQARIDEINLVLEQIEYERQLETAATRRTNEVRNRYREEKKATEEHAAQVKLMGDQLAAQGRMNTAAEAVLAKFGMMRTVAAGVANELERGAAAAFAIANQGSPSQIAYGGRGTVSEKPVIDQYGNPVPVFSQNRPKPRPTDIDFGYYPDDTVGGGSKRETQLRKEISLVKELTQAEKDRQTIVQSVQSSLESGFMSMVDGTKSVTDSFKSMARDIIKELYRVLVVQRMVGGITNAFGPLTGPSTGSFGLPFGGKNASGGSMIPGKSYLVGENGPELVVPRHSGTVMNANQTANALGGGSGNVTVQNNITVTGSDAAMVRAEVAKMIPQITNATKAAVIDAKQRGGQMAAAFR